jgi:hypothetical protein
MEMAKFCKCGNEIPLQRLKILPNTTTCVKCSTTQQKRSITVQLGEGDHTYNELVIMDAEEYQLLEPYITGKKTVTPDKIEEEQPVIQILKEFETSDDIIYQDDYNNEEEEIDETETTD